MAYCNMEKDSGRSAAKDAPQPAEDATPAPVFVKIGREQFPVPIGYGGRLESV